MKIPLLSLALLTAQLTTAIADTMPKISSETLCKARSDSDRMMKFAELQSVADCVREENNAKQKLDSVWSTTDSKVRNRCKADALALGTLSYVDLLTCIQMADDLKSPSPGAKSPSSPSPGK
jgi:hypothetical protein